LNVVLTLQSKGEKEAVSNANLVVLIFLLFPRKVELINKLVFPASSPLLKICFNSPCYF